jgi:alanyl-tRNA synthetase
VRSTGEIGLFKVVSESAVAAGVRRVEAITATGAEAYIQSRLSDLQQVRELINNPKDIVKGVAALVEENSILRKQLEALQHEKAQQVKAALLKQVEERQGMNVIIAEVDLQPELIKTISYELRQQVQRLFCFLATANEGKPHLSLMMDEVLVNEKGLNATQLIRDLAKEIQGGGGGQPFYATAGGKKAEGIPSVLEKVKGLV